MLQEGVRFLRMETPVGVTQPSSHLTLLPAPGTFSGSPLGPAKAWEYPRGEGKNKLHSFIYLLDKAGGSTLLSLSGGEKRLS